MLVAGLAASHAGTTVAHQIWLEQHEQGKAQLYFGEFGENLRETSPGLLDKFVNPTGQKINAQAVLPLEVSKKDQSFVLEGRVRAGESLVAEESNYPITERKQGDQVSRNLYHPAARLIVDWTQQAPHLKLDLVPTGRQGAKGHELRAVYEGQPLPKAKVSVITASGWSREYHTDESGLLEVQLPWRGTYVLELSHSDGKGGEREGQRYDRATYVTSLTFHQAKGLPNLPALPSAPPNKLN